MSNADLDLFELSVASDIKRIKPKVKKRGYAKELVEKLYSVIEEALTNGCSYDEIADAISTNQVKISPSTLKQYHVHNRGQRAKSHKNDNSKVNASNLSLDQNKIEVNQQPKQQLQPKERDNLVPLSQKLSGATLTDEDYLDDFNNY
jgi:site-specific DNA-cytosine methylase